MKYALLITTVCSLLFSYVMLFCRRNSQKYQDLPLNSIFRKIFCFGSKKVLLRIRFVLVFFCIIATIIVSVLYAVDCFVPFLTEISSVIIGCSILVFTLIYSAVVNVFVEINIDYGIEKVTEDLKRFKSIKK